MSQDGAVDCQWRIIDSKVDSTVSVTSLDKPDIKIPTWSRSSSTEVADTMTTVIPLALPPLPVTPLPGLPLLETNHTHIMTQVRPKRKRINSVPQWNVKKVKFCHDIDPSAPILLNVPLGTQWQNNSCAYDAIITVLFNIWFDFNTQSGTASIEDTQCVMFNNLIQRFRSHERCCSQVVAGSPTYSLEQICEYFRHSLARVSQEFTFGSYASIQSIAEYLFHSQEIITTSNVFCSDGHRTNGRDRQSSISSYQIIILGSTERSLQACMDNFTHQLASKCTTCDSNLIRCTTFIQSPPLLAFDLSSINASESESALTLDPVVWISCDGSHVHYVIRVVIYFDNQHFTEHIVTSTGMIWYHDGIFTGRSPVYESQDLTSITTENSVMAFYIRSN